MSDYKHNDVFQCAYYRAYKKAMLYTYTCTMYIHYI